MGTCMDFLGNEFESKEAMCEHYGISSKLFYTRQARGWSLEDSLTKAPVNSSEEDESLENCEKIVRFVEDHVGNKFKSESAMCAYYNIGYSTFKGRIRRGMSLEEALTTATYEKKGVYDHLGNKYKNVAEMCRAYNIDRNVYENRKRKGWTLDRILTTSDLGYTRAEEKKVHHGILCEDHFGNMFNSIKDMCDNYGVSIGTYNYRMRSGWSLREVLESGNKYHG